MRDCVFCQIVRGEIPSHKICENDLALAFISLEGHPLIIPKRHLKDIFDLDEVRAGAVMKMAIDVAKATKSALACDGINLIQANGKSAGQDVFHFHLHIKPRFEDDNVTLSWDTNTLREENRRQNCQLICEHLAVLGH